MPCYMNIPKLMKLIPFALLVVFVCTGCGRDQLPSSTSVPEDVPPVTTSERSQQYPKVEWSEPVSDEANAISATRSGWPANIITVRERFTKRRWTAAKEPRFTVWLTENDFFRITIAADSTEMVGTVKTTRTIDEGPMRGELIPEIRTTEPFANEGEALSLLEAYLKQDGTFETLVRWSDIDTGERSP